jgi:hypothetical protein
LSSGPRVCSANGRRKEGERPLAVKRRTGFLDPIRGWIHELEERILPETAGPVARITVRRAIVAAIVFLITFVVLAPIFNFAT